MMTALFFGFVALMVVVVIGLSARYLGGWTAKAIAAALSGWLLYVGSIGYCGVIRNITMRPPGAAFLFIPVVAFLVFFVLRVRSAAGERVAFALAERSQHCRPSLHPDKTPGPQLLI